MSTPQIFKMPQRKRLGIWVMDGYVWGYYHGPRARYLYLGRLMIAWSHRLQQEI